MKKAKVFKPAALAAAAAMMIPSVLAPTFANGDDSELVNNDQSDDEINSMKINHVSLTLKEGEKATFEATFDSEDADAKVTWESSDTDVLSVEEKDNTVTVIANTVGTATITAKTLDGKHSAVCTVTVTASDSDGNSTDDDNSSTNEDQGTKDDNQSSTDDSQSTNDNGQDTANTDQNTSDNTSTESDDIDGSITIDKNEIIIKTGKSEMLTITLGEEIQDDVEVECTSSDGKIATIKQNGYKAEITGIAEGDAVITVKTKDGTHLVECKVSIAKANESDKDADNDSKDDKTDTSSDDSSSDTDQSSDSQNSDSQGENTQDSDGQNNDNKTDESGNDQEKKEDSNSDNQSSEDNTKESDNTDENKNSESNSESGDKSGSEDGNVDTSGSEDGDDSGDEDEDDSGSEDGDDSGSEDGDDSGDEDGNENKSLTAEDAMISLNTNSVTIKPDDSVEIKAILGSSVSENAELEWESTDQDVVTVDDDGVNATLYAIMEGEADIIVKIAGTDHEAVCHVVVSEKVSSDTESGDSSGDDENTEITDNENTDNESIESENTDDGFDILIGGASSRDINKKLNVGDKMIVSVWTVDEKDSGDELGINYKWTSSDPSVISLEETVSNSSYMKWAKALKAGKSTITVESEDGNLKASVELEVVDKDDDRTKTGTSTGSGNENDSNVSSDTTNNRQSVKSDSEDSTGKTATTKSSTKKSDDETTNGSAVPAKSKAVQTGDNSTPIKWIAGMLISAVVLIGGFIQRKNSMNDSIIRRR